MISKLFVGVTLVGLVCGYFAMIYAFAYTFASIADSYWQNLAMLSEVV
jgi:hypothetical protein